MTDLHDVSPAASAKPRAALSATEGKTNRPNLKEAAERDYTILISRLKDLGAARSRIGTQGDYAEAAAAIEHLLTSLTEATSRATALERRVEELEEQLRIERATARTAERISGENAAALLHALRQLSEAREALKTAREGISIAAGWARSKPDSQRARDKIKAGLDAIRRVLNPGRDERRAAHTLTPESGEAK